MKRILLPLALVLAVSAQAQITNNTKAKVDPKNNKVSNPVVEKPKPKLMTRDELRACFDVQDANRKEAQALQAAQAEWVASQAALKNEKATVFDPANEQLEKVVAEMKAEKEAILAETAAIEKLEKSEKKARIAAFQTRLDAFNASLEKAKAFENELNAKRREFTAKVDKLEETRTTLEDRREKLLDAQDQYKETCTIKLVDEADLKAVKAEREAAAK